MPRSKRRWALPPELAGDGWNSDLGGGKQKPKTVSPQSDWTETPAEEPLTVGNPADQAQPLGNIFS